ncbi:hypothetical protein ACPA0O_07095 [Ectopseudomonas chengduensis]|jgi:hypothetical protein|nr:hypothetical protein [Pseudomonas sp. WS 5019]NMY15698.1 hypothetical protein [Pseudomonas sp. WS 5019]
MTPRIFIVTTAHISDFPNPITFIEGAPLTVGEQYQGDEGWDNWFFCSTPGQEAGWVPGQVIERLDDLRARAREAYTARELDVQVGERLIASRSLNGWHWCTRQDGRESGWVPQANLVEHAPYCVVQEEVSGCGIAASANILGKTYAEMKAIANAMGIHAEDESLWSDTRYVRRLLATGGAAAATGEAPFTSWESLPDLALLAIKHHQENGRDFWHWVVFERSAGQMHVLDSASYLPSNIRTDFGAMQPKWYIEVNRPGA